MGDDKGKENYEEGAMTDGTHITYGQVTISYVENWFVQCSLCSAPPSPTGIILALLLVHYRLSRENASAAPT